MKGVGLGMPGPAGWDRLASKWDRDAFTGLVITYDVSLYRASVDFQNQEKTVSKASAIEQDADL